MKKTICFVLISVLSSLASLPEGMSFLPYGSVQFRFRYDYLTESIESVTSSSGNYSNTIGYKVGLKAAINPQTKFQFEIGNDWGSTEAISIDKGHYLGRRSLSPYFSLAYMQWDPGYMHIEFGRVPVKGTHLTDILGMSIYKEKKNYKTTSHLPWISTTNGSLDGFRIGAPISKDEFKFGIDLFTSIMTQRNANLDKDFLQNADGVLIMMELPLSYKRLNLLPQIAAIPYRNYDKVHKEKDHEFMGGVDGSFKINGDVSLRFGYSAAIFKQNVTSDSTSSNDIVKKQVGMNGGIGSTVKLGAGKLDLDFKIASDDNMEIDNDKEFYPYIDARYSIPFNKYFSMMPRIRMFITSTENDVTTIKSRPELIFTGSF